MRRYGVFPLILAAQLLWAASALGQGGYKIEAIHAPASSDLPRALQDSLQPEGTRLRNDQGSAVCEVWLRKSIPLKHGTSESADILYGSLDVGTVVGVLRFPSGGSDFRGQTIKAGFYTLRYALIPQDGNHMGVSPNRDFVLLSPAAVDTEPDKQVKFDDLVKLSRQASGTPHPAVLSLVPLKEAASPSFPALVHDDQGHWVLQVKIHGTSAAGSQELPIAITLVGKAEAA